MELNATHCVECERERKPGERGWVVVLSHSEEAGVLYCPACFGALTRGAASRNGQD